MSGPSWMRCSAIELLSAWASVLATMKSTPSISAVDHVGDGVAAGAADADHGDPRAQLLDRRRADIDAHCVLSSGSALHDNPVSRLCHKADSRGAKGKLNLIHSPANAA